MAVLTAGIAPEHGAEVAVALGALVEARLSAAGVEDYRVVPSAEGFRVRALLPRNGSEVSTGKVRELAATLRDALLTPLAKDGPEMNTVSRKLEALARRPLPDPLLYAVAECTGEPFATRASGSEPPLTSGTVDAWRIASHGLGRVAFAAVGTREEVDALVAAVGGSAPWPLGAPVASSIPTLAENVQIYDATPDLPAGAARISVVVETPDSERAVLLANALGNPRGSLATRLSTLEPLARLRNVTATAHLGWGCVEITLDLPPPDGSADPPATLAEATDLVREEAVADLASVGNSSAGVHEIANRAGDPRDAAERLAYWTVAAAGPGHSSAGVSPAPSIVIGVSAPRGSSAPELGERGRALRAELDRTVSARSEPVGDVRVKVERGQSDLWVLLASPCGTEAETEADAGSGAVAVVALADLAHHATEGSNAVVEEWVTADGLGLIVHAPPAPTESSAAVAHRVAELLAKTFGALAESHDLAAARTRLLTHPASPEVQRGFSMLADAIAPGHPSWLLPSGTIEGLERSSDETVRARLDALRAGPLRIAVLADHDTSQADVVLQTIGGWLPHRTRSPSTCAQGTNPNPPRPGTYAVEAPGASSVDAWLAFPLPPGDTGSRASAELLVAALTARGGLLEHALGAGLARSWGAKVLESARAPALAVWIGSAQGSLDAAVAEARVLFDRLRQEGLTEADRTRALAKIADARLESTLDPKARLVALWRGDTDMPPSGFPGLEEIKAFAARTLREEALTIVASRPPRGAARAP
jgi:hypothetical protein